MLGRKVKYKKTSLCDFTEKTLRFGFETKHLIIKLKEG